MALCPSRLILLEVSGLMNQVIDSSVEQLMCGVCEELGQWFIKKKKKSSNLLLVNLPKGLHIPTF